MRVDAAVEHQLPAKAGLERRGLHVGRGRLQGLDAVEPGFDHGRHQRHIGAAAVHHDPLAVVVPQAAQPLQMREDEAAKERLAHQRPGLAAEIVADKENVDRIAGRGEDPLADGRVVVDDVLQNGVDQLPARRTTSSRASPCPADRWRRARRATNRRRGWRIAASTPAPRRESARRPSRPDRARDNRGPPRAWPWPADDSAAGRSRNRAVGRRTACGSRAGAQVRGGAESSGPVYRAKTRRKSSPNADAEALVVRQAQLPAGLGEKFRRRAAPARHAVGLDMRKSGQNSLASNSWFLRFIRDHQPAFAGADLDFAVRIGRPPRAENP